MSLEVIKKMKGEFPYNNKSMTELDHRLYALYIEIEQLKTDLYIDRYQSSDPPKLHCHMNFPCEIGNLGVSLFKIATLLNECGTHNGKI